MPVLNPHPLYFRESLESIISQTVEQIEIIVVEDPSPRTAKDVIDSMNDPRIRYFFNRERTSLVLQRNRGLAEARAEFVAMQDADDIAEKDRLEKQLKFFAAHPAISVLGTQMHVMNFKGEHLGYRRYPRDSDSILQAMPLFNAIAQPTVMFRKQVIQAAGGYQYIAHAVEDYELWSRLAVQGVRFSNHPEALLRYRIHVDANKVNKLHDTVRGTIEIKKMYWLKNMSISAKARMCMEYFMLWLPGSVILNLFLKTQLWDTLLSNAD